MGKMWVNHNEKNPQNNQKSKNIDKTETKNN